MSTPRLKLSELRGFPENFHENGKIKTTEFINASHEVIMIIEQFGRIFTPIVMDMKGNAGQLMEIYEKDKENWEFIEDLVLTSPYGNSRSALLWLKRALELIERFFYYIMNDSDIVARKTDNLQPMLVRAYEEVLQPYHGFVLRQTFSMLNRWIPNRISLLGNDESFDDNIRNLHLKMPKMRMHIDKIDAFLKENGFDDQSKV